jgi:DNA adenine methylase
MNKSPLRYPGGKTRAFHPLNEIVLEYFDMASFDKIVSPFFGGGSFEFFLQHSYNLHIMANDILTPLIHFWKSCQSNNGQLCSEIEKDLGKMTIERCKAYRSELIESMDPLRTAKLFFELNRCSFSGCTLSGGFSKEAIAKRFTPSSVEKIRALDLTRISFENSDFERFLERTQDGLLFVDPPYYLEKHHDKLYGVNGNLHQHFSHERLYRVLCQRSHWLLTYNDCDYIRDLYKDFIIKSVEWGYGMNKSKKSSEIVIINPL